MKANNRMIRVSLMFVIFAAAFSVIFWGDVSYAVKIAYFATGFGSGVAAGIWFARRN